MGRGCAALQLPRGDEACEGRRRCVQVLEVKRALKFYKTIFVTCSSPPPKPLPSESPAARQVPTRPVGGESLYTRF